MHARTHARTSVCKHTHTHTHMNARMVLLYPRHAHKHTRHHAVFMCASCRVAVHDCVRGIQSHGTPRHQSHGTPRTHACTDGTIAMDACTVRPHGTAARYGRKDARTHASMHERTHARLYACMRAQTYAHMQTCQHMCVCAEHGTQTHQWLIAARCGARRQAA